MYFTLERENTGAQKYGDKRGSWQLAVIYKLSNYQLNFL
jgi:hypothetical protein